MNKAVFLDRDGTIVKDVTYCRREEDLHLLPTVSEAIKLLNIEGFKVIVITNQSGIARGLFDEITLVRIHKKMAFLLYYTGAYVDAIYYCPHLPSDGCDCRKPAIGLFKRATKDWDIDLRESYVVGDTWMDITAGKVLGSKTILVKTGLVDFVPGSEYGMPNFTADNLLEASKWLLRDISRS